MSDDRKFWSEIYESDPDQAGIPDFFIEEETEILAVGTALDVGCGLGLNAMMLARKGWDVEGIDWAPEAVKLANDKAGAEGLKARFFVGDLTTWTAIKSYDLVYSTFAMPEGPGRAEAVRAMISALRPGGTLIICEWDKRMARPWGFKADALPSPAELEALMPELIIEEASVREVENALQEEQANSNEPSKASVAFVRARKPGG